MTKNQLKACLQKDLLDFASVTGGTVGGCYYKPPKKIPKS